MSEELHVFKEVPGHDPRTLVLEHRVDGEIQEYLDLEFCSCVTKYKKRFAQFLQDFPTFLDEAKSYAVTLADNGYTNIEVGDILDALRAIAKTVHPAADYMKYNPHDFNLDKASKDFLARKLMMTEPRLVGKIAISPIKCKGSCGYPETQVDTSSQADPAGF